MALQGRSTGWRLRAGVGLLGAAGLALLLYAAVLVALWFGQERLLFQPQRLPAEHRFTGLGPDVQELWVEVPGARLNALHLQRPGARGVVLYLHGNGGSLQSWFVNADWWAQQGLDLFMLDYRGYGKSSGSINSEAQLHADARAAWAAMLARYGGRPPRATVVFGRSLGTGLASALAAEVNPALTVLVSPFFSMQRLAAELYPWVPAPLLRYPLRSDSALPHISGPVLLLHGTQDTLIPLAHAQALLPLNPRARLVAVEGAGHNDIQRFAPYLQALSDALAGLPP